MKKTARVEGEEGLLVMRAPATGADLSASGWITIMVKDQMAKNRTGQF